MAARQSRKGKGRSTKKVEATHRKNPAAVALGRLGGMKGGRARAANMTPEERSEAARKAINARWANMTAEERSEAARLNAAKGWKTRKRRGAATKPE